MTKLVKTAFVATAVEILLAVTPVVATGLTITQHPLPDYAHDCGEPPCRPSPAQALLAAGPGRVLASAVEGGTAARDVYTEIALGPKVVMTPGPAGSPAYAMAPGLNGHPWVIFNDGSMRLADAPLPGLTTLFQYGPDSKAQPTGLTTGAGAAWLINHEKVDRILGGSVTSFSPPGLWPGEYPLDIVAGPEESAWYTNAVGAIEQITATGQEIDHTIGPDPRNVFGDHARPRSIAVGPEGAIWWTDEIHARIGRMTDDGAFQEFDIPDHRPPDRSAGDSFGPPRPRALVAGPEHEFMYFTDPGDNAIGRVSVVSGEVTEYPIPATSLVFPADITVAGNELVFDESEAVGEGHEVGLLGSIMPNTSPGDSPLTTPPSRSEIVTALQAQLKRATMEARPAFRRRRQSFALTVTPPEAGSLIMTWTAVTRAPTRKHTVTTPVAVATARAAFGLARTATVAVKLTSEGLRLRSRGGRRSHLRLTLQATFSGLWAGQVEASVRQGA